MCYGKARYGTREHGPSTKPVLIGDRKIPVHSVPVNAAGHGSAGQHGPCSGVLGTDCPSRLVFTLEWTVAREQLVFTGGEYRT